MQTLRHIIRALIVESLLPENVDVSEVGEMCYVDGSTHTMMTCKIGNDKYFLKFSETSLFDHKVHPSLQILIEYLAYSIYSLYSGIVIPNFQLVFDAEKDSVGLATTPARGRQALGRIRPINLGEMLSQGVYVDIFLANWDVIGTGSGNVFVDDDVLTRIDPGGALTFRAQGGRKGRHFNPSASELETMLDPNFGGSGAIFQYSDLLAAAQEFNTVSWDAIATKINEVYVEVNNHLLDRGMSELSKQWTSEVNTILPILGKRWSAIAEHIAKVR